ncbi:MAG TPA: hypothetical protein VLJ16_04195 [Acidobacteriota bacterium]|nr:hypothetical protein [Acidobacteriota bacterium]
MNTFIFWLDKPFHPGRMSKPIRRRTRFVTIRYRGSFARSAIKTLIVLALLAIMSNVGGERTSQSLDANEIAHQAGSAGIHR